MINAYISLQKIKATGTLIGNLKVGEWTFFDWNKNKFIVNYSSEGKLEGNYKEYYYDDKTDTYNLKVKGQFGTRTYKLKFGNEYKDVRKTRRIGKWEYYSEQNELLEVVIHKWKSNK